MKALKVVELTKDDKKVIVTLWDSNLISSCVEEVETQQCDSCQGDEKACSDFVDYLKEKGYGAKEVALGELGDEESLPKFLEEKKAEVEPVAEEE